MAPTPINLRSKPSRFSTPDAARRWAAGCNKTGDRAAWVVRLDAPIVATPKFGRPATLAAGWLVCLPVDAGRLESAGLGTIDLNW